MVTFFGYALTGALKAAVDALGALTIGMDPLDIEAITAKSHAAAGASGPGGIFTLAISAIDIALWDIKGKALNVSVAQLAGGHRTQAPTYASGALMRQFSLDTVVRSSARLVEKGFRQMKMQLALPGHTTPEIAVERTRVIRAGLGLSFDRDVLKRYGVS